METQTCDASTYQGPAELHESGLMKKTLRLGSRQSNHTDCQHDEIRPMLGLTIIFSSSIAKHVGRLAGVSSPRIAPLSFQATPSSFVVVPVDM